MWQAGENFKTGMRSSDDHDLRPWTHPHHFQADSRAAERGTLAVLALTAGTMVVEIAAGWWFNSMALLADGWHMSSHALAIGLSALAYRAARHYAHDGRFAFGPWKIEALAGFASALFLLGVAALMVVGSVERLLHPQDIRFREAIAVAVLGLVVNLLSAWILHRAGHHDAAAHAQGHHQGPSHRPHGHADLNLRAAYLHVVADAATSLLALGALLGGLAFGWAWLDPVMGIVGAALVAHWAAGLVRQTSRVLLDREMDHPVVHEVHEAIARLPGHSLLADLHLWRVGRHAFAGALSVVTHDPGVTADTVRAALREHEELAHLTVEVHHCPCQGEAHRPRPVG